MALENFNKHLYFIFFIIISMFTGLIIYINSRKNKLTNNVEVSECTPYNFVIHYNNKANSVNLSWLTQNTCNAYVKFYDLHTSIWHNFRGTEQGTTEKEYSISVGNLSKDKTYAAIIVSGGKNYGIEGYPILIRLKEK